MSSPTAAAVDRLLDWSRQRPSHAPPAVASTAAAEDTSASHVRGSSYAWACSSPWLRSGACSSSSSSMVASSIDGTVGRTHLRALSDLSHASRPHAAAPLPLHLSLCPLPLAATASFQCWEDDEDDAPTRLESRWSMIVVEAPPDDEPERKPWPAPRASTHSPPLRPITAAASSGSFNPGAAVAGADLPTPTSRFDSALSTLIQRSDLLAATQQWWSIFATAASSRSSRMTVPASEYLRIRLTIFAHLSPGSFEQPPRFSSPSIALLARVAQRDFMVDMAEDLTSSDPASSGLTLPNFHASLAQLALHFSHGHADSCASFLSALLRAITCRSSEGERLTSATRNRSVAGPPVAKLQLPLPPTAPSSAPNSRESRVLIPLPPAVDAWIQTAASQFEILRVMSHVQSSADISASAAIRAHAALKSNNLSTAQSAPSPTDTACSMMKQLLEQIQQHLSGTMNVNERADTLSSLSLPLVERPSPARTSPPLQVAISEHEFTAELEAASIDVDSDYSSPSPSPGNSPRKKAPKRVKPRGNKKKIRKDAEAPPSSAPALTLVLPPPSPSSRPITSTTLVAPRVSAEESKSHSRSGSCVPSPTLAPIVKRSAPPSAPNQSPTVVTEFDESMQNRTTAAQAEEEKRYFTAPTSTPIPAKDPTSFVESVPSVLIASQAKRSLTRPPSGAKLIPSPTNAQSHFPSPLGATSASRPAGASMPASPQARQARSTLGRRTHSWHELPSASPPPSFPPRLQVSTHRPSLSVLGSSSSSSHTPPMHSPSVNAPVIVRQVLAPSIATPLPFSRRAGTPPPASHAPSDFANGGGAHSASSTRAGSFSVSSSTSSPSSSSPSSSPLGVTPFSHGAGTSTQQGKLGRYISPSSGAGVLCLPVDAVRGRVRTNNSGGFILHSTTPTPATSSSYSPPAPPRAPRRHGHDFGLAPTGPEVPAPLTWTATFALLDQAEKTKQRATAASAHASPTHVSQQARKNTD